MLNRYDRQSTRSKRVIHALTEKKKKKKKEKEIYFLSVGAAFQFAALETLANKRK